MDGSAIQELKKTINENQIVEIDGRKFAPRGYQLIRHIDKPEAIALTTLLSFAEFVKSNPQKLNYENGIIVIDEEFTVKLVSSPSPENEARTVFAYARNPVKPFPFGKLHDSESFSIALQTQFVADDNEKALWTICSQIQIEEGVTFIDDGKSQKIKVQKGISAASIEDRIVPSVTLLKPFRIFSECDQPESPFLVRLNGDKESGAFVTLYETDGGAWKVQAAVTIAKTLSEAYGVTLPIFY